MCELIVTFGPNALDLFEISPYFIFPRSKRPNSKRADFFFVVPNWLSIHFFQLVSTEISKLIRISNFNRNLSDTCLMLIFSCRFFCFECLTKQICLSSHSDYRNPKKNGTNLLRFNCFIVSCIAWNQFDFNVFYT